jgi:esterase/lipase superfamily enzyme
MKYTIRQINIFKKMPDKLFYWFAYKFILLLLILSSCNASKKCERISSKAIALKCFKNDTIKFYDTTFGQVYDTFVQFKTNNEFDTLFVDSGGVKVKTIIRWKTKELWQTITKDTIIKEFYRVNKVITKKEIPQWTKWIWFAFVMILVGIYISYKK